MANTPMYDPKTSEARSSWLAGLTEACAKLSNSLNMKTISTVDLPLNELFISDDDRYRIYQAELGQKLWLSEPAPVIKQNGLVITPENDYFTIDYLGGSIAFEQGHTLDENDTVTANVTYITGASSEIESLNAAIQSAQQSAMSFRGYYQTYDNLVADISDPQTGNFAIVGGTDNSVYIWNSTDNEWKNTFKETDLSDYYTKEEVDTEIDKKIDNIGEISDTEVESMWVES